MIRCDNPHVLPHIDQGLPFQKERASDTLHPPDPPRSRHNPSGLTIVDKGMSGSARRASDPLMDDK